MSLVLFLTIFSFYLIIPFIVAGVCNLHGPGISHGAVMMGSYELVGKAVSTWDTGEHAGLGVSFESNQIWYAAQVVHVFLGSGRGLGVVMRSMSMS